MNLQEALTLPQKENFTNVDRFLRNGHGMPPLDKNCIGIEGLYGEERKRMKTLTNGDGSLFLTYKGKEGSVLSIEEAAEGELWRVIQVQGAQSRKSYRLCTGLDWPECLGSVVRSISERVDTIVREVQMPSIESIEGVCESRSEHVNSIYQKVAQVIGLRFSEEERAFVRDLKKETWV